jgi:hypothetical protein
LRASVGALLVLMWFLERRRVVHWKLLWDLILWSSEHGL